MDERQRLFEQLVSEGHEGRTLEYKRSASWDDTRFRLKLVRTILAMANTPDGGSIIIGVPEATGVHVARPAGMMPEHVATYREDLVKDEVAKFASPRVDIRMSVEHCGGGDYVWIRIDPFDALPVVCKRNGPDLPGGAGLCAGRVYCRPASGRPRTESVQGEWEMRDILDRAVELEIGRRRARGGTAPSSSPAQPADLAIERFNHEADAVEQAASGDVVDRICAAGYWRFRLQPLREDPEHAPGIVELQELAQQLRISLQGSEFPPLDSTLALKRGRSWAGAEYASPWRLVCWWLFRSGQFLSIQAVTEDHLDEPHMAERPSHWLPDVRYLEVVNAVRDITGWFLYAAGLARHVGGYDSGAALSLELRGCTGRELAFADDRRELEPPRRYDDDLVPFEHSYDRDELVERSHDLALDAMCEVVQHFGWTDPRDVLAEDQARMLGRRT